MSEQVKDASYYRNRASVLWAARDFAGAAEMRRILQEIHNPLPISLPTPAATPTDSANPPPVESVGPNSEAQS